MIITSHSSWDEMNEGTLSDKSTLKTATPVLICWRDDERSSMLERARKDMRNFILYCEMLPGVLMEM